MVFDASANNYLDSYRPREGRVSADLQVLTGLERARSVGQQQLDRVGNAEGQAMHRSKSRMRLELSTNRSVLHIPRPARTCEYVKTRPSPGR